MNEPPAANVPYLRLGEIALARSGDKGNHANIGVVAYTQAGYDFLRQNLTAERVAEYFQALGPSRVVRYELPRLYALNFVLYDALAGGASRSLRIDTQGKLLGTAILDLTLPLPSEARFMRRQEAEASAAATSGAGTRVGPAAAGEAASVGRPAGEAASAHDPCGQSPARADPTGESKKGSSPSGGASNQHDISGPFT